MATTTTGGPDNTTEPPELTKLTDEPVVTSQPRRLVRTTSDDSGIYDEDTEHGPTSENEDNREDTDSDRGTDSELDLVEVDLSDETTHTEEADAESRETNAVVETQPSSRAGLMPPFMFGDFSETDEGDLETAISDNNKEHYTTAELPTVLRDREPLDIVDAGDNTPARLILDQLDDDDDVVLFDAHINQKLSLTSNPLYEYTLLEETRRYQAGYTAPFNSVDVIQTCQPATSSRVVAAGRESGTCPTSPTEEKACCTIL